MRDKTLAFLKAGTAFFIWSLLGPILNLSKLDAFQNLFILSVLPVAGIFLYDYFFNKLQNFKKLKINFPVLLFLLFSGLNGIFFFKGLTLMPIAQAFLLFSTMPILTFLIEVIFLKEKIIRSLVIALLLAMIGVFVVLSKDLGDLSLTNTNYLL